KWIRYSLVSVVSVVVSVAFLVLFDGLFGWSGVVSSTLATAIATVPSYELNRRWVWKKGGKSHLGKEVLPFWVLTFIGWALSTYAVKLTEDFANGHHFSHPLRTAVIVVVYVGSFGVVWVAKFIVCNKVLFRHSPEVVDAGVPG
ncbi:MAG: GtrA family protein, partial [Acidimicrobiales bacterium]